MKRLAALTLTLTLVAISCSGDDESSTTSESATPTTDASQETTTTQLQLVDGGLIPIDPASLIPVDGGDTVLVARAFSGVGSPSGTHAAVVALDDSGSQTMNIIEVAGSSVLATATVGNAAIEALSVHDDGTTTWLTVDEGPRLMRLDPDAGAATVLYEDFPDDYYPNTARVLLDGTTATSGPHEDGSLRIVLIDASAESHAEIELPDVSADIDATFVPAVVWDDLEMRALVVAADVDTVYVVDLDTGSVEEQQLFGGDGEEKGESARKDAALSPDGMQLIVATEENGRPLPLEVVTLTTWETSELSVEADSLTVSPDGFHLIAHTGAGPGSTHLIDMSVPEVIASFDSGATSPVTPQFSGDGAYAYLQTNDESGTTIETLDVAIQQLTGAVGFTRISLVGPAALMAFHVS